MMYVSCCCRFSGCLLFLRCQPLFFAVHCLASPPNFFSIRAKRHRVATDIMTLHCLKAKGRHGLNSNLLHLVHEAVLLSNIYKEMVGERHI